MLQSHSHTDDLKRALLVRATLVALISFCLTALWSGYKAKNAAFASNEAAAETVGRLLDLQLMRIRSALDYEARFPDGERILEYILEPGQCIAYLDRRGEAAVSQCRGLDDSKTDVPAPVSTVIATFTDLDITARRPAFRNGEAIGQVVVNTDPKAVTSLIWKSISPMGQLFVVMASTLGFSIYFTIQNLLSPARAIVAGLNRFANGETDTRLPNFRLVELERISAVFNDLAERLETTSREREGLARKLVETHENERRFLAREVHDEIAQSITALTAFSAALQTKVDIQCPDLTDDVALLSKTSRDLLSRTRRLLGELRLPAVDELGLVKSIEGLIADHKHQYDCSTRRYKLHASSGLEELPHSLTTDVFRIVQEALANVAKHSSADLVSITLNRMEEEHGAVLLLCVSDNGVGFAEPRNAKHGHGFGIIGIRERVVALGGSFYIGSTDPGCMLKVKIPI